MLQPWFQMSGFGQTPTSVVAKTVDGITFRLWTGPIPAENPDRKTFIAPTFGKVVTLGPAQIDAKQVGWFTFEPTAVSSIDFFNQQRAAGNAVLVSDGPALENAAFIDGQPVRGPLEGYVVAARDIDLIGKISAADPDAGVLFEPSGGWEHQGGQPATGPSKALLVGAGVLVAGGLLYFVTRRR
jgi:hypothetical protein